MTITKSIIAHPVLRDGYGCWTHPDFFIATYDSGPELEAEFKHWLSVHRLRSATSWMENDVTEEMMVAYDNGETNLSDWTPVAPGREWFVGSIHDTQAGPVCIWLRALTDEEAGL